MKKFLGILIVTFVAMLLFSTNLHAQGRAEGDRPNIQSLDDVAVYMDSILYVNVGDTEQIGFSITNNTNNLAQVEIEFFDCTGRVNLSGYSVVGDNRGRWSVGYGNPTIEEPSLHKYRFMGMLATSNDASTFDSFGVVLDVRARKALTVCPIKAEVEMHWIGTDPNMETLRIISRKTYVLTSGLNL